MKGQGAGLEGELTEMRQELARLARELEVERDARETAQRNLHEVAQRLVRDDAGGGDYRAMSVRVHYYSKPYYIRPVSRHCFMPPPNVESCLIGFKPKEPQTRPLIPACTGKVRHQESSASMTPGGMPLEFESVS